MRIALIFIVLLALLFPLLFTVTGDGVTLKSRIQMFLTWSLWAVTFVLSMLTIFLACWCLSYEVREKHIQLVAVKPIARWQFVVGKWLGIIVLDLALLAVCGGTVYGFVRYLVATHTPVNEEDRIGVFEEILAARGHASVKCPDLPARVEDRIRQLRNENRLPASAELDEIRRNIAREIESEYLTVPPEGSREYVFAFSRFLVVRRPDTYVTIRFRPGSGQTPEWDLWRSAWEAGDPRKQTAYGRVVRSDASDRYHTIQIPTECVAEDGTLRVVVHNLDPTAAMVFTGMEGRIELLYPIGGFGWNFVRALTLIATRLVFLAAMGVMFSSFLSFPVACMATLILFFLSIGVGFLGEALQWTMPSSSSGDPFWILGPALRAINHAMIWIVPDLSKFDPIPTLAEGRVVSLMWIISGTVQLVLTRAALLGLLACVIFTRREMAEVVA